MHSGPVPGACVPDCNGLHRTQECAAGAAHKRSASDPGTRTELCLFNSTLPGMHWNQAAHAGAGGGFGHSPALSRNISWNLCWEMANWTVPEKPHKPRPKALHGLSAASLFVNKPPCQVANCGGFEQYRFRKRSPGQALKLQTDIHGQKRIAAILEEIVIEGDGFGFQHPSPEL
jgi:hypothetical protein